MESSNFKLFARRVTALLICGHYKKGFLGLLDAAGASPDEVDPVESFLYRAFPFDLLTALPHFGEKSDAMGSALRTAIVERAAELGNLAFEDADQTVAERFAEYNELGFHQGLPLGIPVAKEDGLLKMAIGAHRYILGYDVGEDHAVPYVLVQYFSTASSTWKQGAKLRELYDEYSETGDSEFVAAYGR